MAVLGTHGEGTMEAGLEPKSPYLYHPLRVQHSTPVHVSGHDVVGHICSGSSSGGGGGRGPEVGATRGVGEWSLGNGDLELGKERRNKEAGGGGERGSRMSGETQAGFYIFLILMKIDCTNRAVHRS